MTLTLQSNDIRPAAALFRRLKIASTLPILDHIRVTVAPGEIEATLETSDLDIHITHRLPIAGPTTPGSFTIPRTEFAHLAAKADKGTTIRFEATGDDVHSTHTAKGLHTQRTAPSLPPGEFPDPAPTAEARTILPTSLLDAIRRVRPAASNDESRYVLNGVYLDPTVCGNVVATDGRRLAHVPVRVPTPACILPTKLVDILADTLCQSAATARFSSEADVAALTFGKTTITSKLIQGNYPNYRQVMPIDHTGSATIPHSVVLSLIDWLRPFKDAAVTIEFTSLTTAAFTVHIKDQGPVTTSIPLYTENVVPRRIAFNSAFLAQGLSMGLHTLDLIDEMSPGVLTDGLVRYVLMPMRTTADAPAAEESEEESEDPSDQSDSSDSSYTDALDQTDAPPEFVTAYDDTYITTRIPEHLNRVETFDRILAQWRAAGEPANIHEFIERHILEPQPQPELPSKKPSRRRKTAAA